MARAIGKLVEFAPAIQTWQDYIEQFEFYLEANNITEANEKRSTLLTAVGVRIYPTIKSLILPKAPKEVSYEEKVAKCTAHFGKTTNELLSRIHFHKRDQLEDESLQDFVHELRKLAQDCKFGVPTQKLPLETMLRDRFLAGIRNEELQRYLCQRHEEMVTESNPDGLTLDKALEIARSAESTIDQQKIIKQKESKSVNKIIKKDRERENKNRHLSRACKSEQKESSKSKPSRAHRVEDDDSQLEKDSDCYSNAIVNKTNATNNNDKYNVRVEINSLPCTFEIDNRSHLSIINREAFKKIWQNSNPDWSKREVKLFVYGKNRLNVMGSTDVSVKYGEFKGKLPLPITEDTVGPNLLGRKWFADLAIKIMGIQRIEKIETDYTKMIDEFPSITSTRLEGHHGTPISILLKENARPKFIKARCIP
ncbi:uncharacterized protein LOC124407960 [Diprion similis]|uniref:uncharacterized protein LOC124407960 n=1 Tax=Diprion similis TaxID=362088 RepID=UPI001EF8C11B|nr:uncharacterized protein LOC124407960 [Diprion similis]